MLDNSAHMMSIDKSNMRSILERFSRQCDKAVKIGKNMEVSPFIKHKKVNKVVVCGLGGSAIGGDILSTLFSNEKITISVNRDYHLPSFVDEKDLVFAVSYSGNTEETISSFKEALNRSCPVVSVASGGELHKLARENNIPVVKIPSGMPPRCAVGFLSIPVIVLLEKILNIELFDYQELVQITSVIGERCGPERETSDNPAKQAALKLKGKVPLIYGTHRVTGVVAHRLKTQFNENSKVLASWNIFPEMNHNEIVPFSGEGEVNLNIFHPLFIRDQKEQTRIARRIQITQNILRKKGVECSQVWTEGRSLISRVFSSMYIGDWISFYLAVLQGVDPTPVTFIDLLKNELKKFEQ